MESKQSFGYLDSFKTYGPEREWVETQRDTVTRDRETEKQKERVYKVCLRCYVEMAMLVPPAPVAMSILLTQLVEILCTRVHRVTTTSQKSFSYNTVSQPWNFLRYLSGLGNRWGLSQVYCPEQQDAWSTPKIHQLQLKKT